MPDYIDDPPDVLSRLRSICLGLPEAYEEPAWVGTRWRIRTHTFAHVRTAETGTGPVTWLKFRSRGPELDALLGHGHPFARGGIGPDVVAMIIDEGTDWTEVGELLTESYRLFAPKRLATLVGADARHRRERGVRAPHGGAVDGESLPVAELGVRWDEVRLCEWTPRWVELFDAEAARLRAALSDAVIEHVGSTAVHDLPAKPIIDILVGVEGENAGRAVAALESLGYRAHTDKDRGDRIFLWLGQGDVSLYHANVTALGSDTWCCLLRLRHLLRSDPRARQRYEVTKRALADQHGNDRLAYLAAKSRFLRELLE